MLCKANKALTKRQRAKKTHIQARGTLSTEDVRKLIKQKDVGKQ